MMSKKIVPMKHKTHSKIDTCYLELFCLQTKHYNNIVCIQVFYGLSPVYCTFNIYKYRSGCSTFYIKYRKTSDKGIYML